MEDLKERLLVRDQVFDVGFKDLQLLNEVFPLLRDERYVTGREEDLFAVCGDERAVFLYGQLGVSQDLQTVLGVLVCAGGGSVVLRHPRAGKVGNTRRAGGVRTLDGLSDSVRTVGEAEADVATSTRSLDVCVVDGVKRRWMVVLCCVVVCCVVLCVLCCVVLCCVGCWVGWLVWCCVVLC